MNILLELFVVTFRVLWAFVLAAAKWLVRPKEKSVAGQVCLITGAGSGLGRLFALEFARRRALLVLWDINTQSNEETAGMVRHIYRELAEAAPKGKRGCALPLGAHLRPSFPGELPLPPQAPGRCQVKALLSGSQAERCGPCPGCPFRPRGGFRLSELAEIASGRVLVYHCDTKVNRSFSALEVSLLFCSILYLPAEIQLRTFSLLFPLYSLVAGDGEKDALPHCSLQVYTYTCDVGKRENVYTTAERVRKEVGEVSVLVNNAGVVSGHHLLECPDELIERTMMVNCHAHFWVTICSFMLPFLSLNLRELAAVA